MAELNKEQEIEERLKKIAQLKEEIAELRAPYSLSALLKNKMIGFDYHGKIIRKATMTNMDGWEQIRKACLALHRGHHRGENMLIKNLSGEEIKTSARMADEMIEIWNKYVVEVYGGKKNA